MSDVALKEALLIGTIAYFNENGTTVDAQTVAQEVLPDNTPTTNWPSMGCILAARFSKDTVNEEVDCPAVSGGYIREMEEHVTADYIDLVCKDYNEFVHRLQWGTSAVVAEDTPQAPFANVDRKVLGWLKIQGRQEDGTDRVRLDLWCEMRLIETPEWSPSRGRPVLRFQRKYSSLNSVEFPS